MFIGKSPKKSHLFLQFHNSQTWLISHQNRYANLIPVQKSRNVITRLGAFYSVMANKSATSLNNRNEKEYIPCNPERPYEVVVATTRDMGIGKDRKLPWTLPSDLRFFKEITTTTSVDGKRNAVIMGRRTWESIPQRYRPLPGRLNVVLSRVGKLGVENSFRDLVVCNDFSLALKLLAGPPYSESIEKVFLIGGGQILKEAMNGPNCEAIHLTDIEANIECDTFIPPIDLSLFHPLFSSMHIVENDIRFSFKTYVRMSNCTEQTYTTRDDESNPKRETIGSKESSFSERCDKFDYIKKIQENIAGGKC